MDEIQGLPRNGNLESRISAAHSRRDEKETEIELMERDYEDWVRDNS